MYFCRQLSRADEWRRCLRIFHTRCILTNRSWRDVPLPARIALQVPGRRFACKCWSYSVRAGQRHFVILPEPPLAGCGWNRRTANLNFWISAGILVKVHCWPVFCGNRFQGFCISVADRVHPCFLLRIRLTGLLARIGPLFRIVAWLVPGIALLFFPGLGSNLKWRKGWGILQGYLLPVWFCRALCRRGAL